MSGRRSLHRTVLPLPTGALRSSCCLGELYQPVESDPVRRSARLFEGVKITLLDDAHELTSRAASGCVDQRPGGKSSKVRKAGARRVSRKRRGQCASSTASCQMLRGVSDATNLERVTCMFCGTCLVFPITFRLRAPPRGSMHDNALYGSIHQASQTILNSILMLMSIYAIESILMRKQTAESPYQTAESSGAEAPVPCQCAETGQSRSRLRQPVQQTTTHSPRVSTCVPGRGIAVVRVSSWIGELPVSGKAASLRCS